MYTIDDLYKAIYDNNIPTVYELLNSPDSITRFATITRPPYLKVILPDCQFLKDLPDASEPQDKYISPLHYALETQKMTISNILINYYAHHNIIHILNISYNGERPIHIASKNGFIDALQLLIQHGVLSTYRDSYGNTPLAYATKYCHLEIMTLLIECCPESVNYFNTKGVTPLHFATKTANIKSIDLLLRNKADINYPMIKDKITPLYIAIQLGHQATVQFLLENGANPNHTNDLGFTMLDIATSMGNIDIIELLIGHNAIINPAAVTIAQRKGLSDIIHLFEFFQYFETALNEQMKHSIIMHLTHPDLLSIIGMRFPEYLPNTIDRIMNLIEPAHIFAHEEEFVEQTFTDQSFWDLEMFLSA